MKPQKRQFEAFEDGVCKVVEMRDMVVTRTIIEWLRYGEKVVGAKRFYDAAVLGNEVEKLITVPMNTFLERHHIIVIKGENYRIIQLQEKPNDIPPNMQLTLEKIVIN